MNDFFADLEQDLLDATSRANESRRRLPAPPRLRVAPLVAFAATAAIVVAVVGIAGVFSGSGERSAVQEPAQEPAFDHEEGAMSCRGAEEPLKEYSVLRRVPTEEERENGERIARAFSDSGPLAGGARLARETATNQYWIVPVGCTTAGNAVEPEPGVCIRRTGTADARGCFNLGHAREGAMVMDEEGAFTPVPDGVTSVTVKFEPGSSTTLEARGNVAIVEFADSDIPEADRRRPGGVFFERDGRRDLTPVDKGTVESCLFDYLPEEADRAAAEVFPFFARKQTRDDKTMPPVEPQGNLEAYHPSGTRFVGAGQGHKYYAFVGMVGKCEKPEEGVCLTAASLNDAAFVCETLAEARKSGVRMLANPDHLVGLAPGDAKTAIAEDIGEFEVRDGFYRGSVGTAGERALTTAIRFE